MNPKLDAIYVALDEATRRIGEAAGPGALAQLDRDAALARDKLAEYGVDLADDVARDAIIAVLNIALQPLHRGDTADLAYRLSALQQACQRANAMSARAGRT